MNQYKQYLAANVLSDGQIINYRLLSRALKVHNAIAKQMLYEFHRTQNAKRPNSVHATYLVIGRKRRQTTHNGAHIKMEEDTPMESSPLPSSLPVPESEQEVEQTPTTSVTLVKEENFEEIHGQFEEIQSVFIYSLAPASHQDYQVLSECNRKVATEYATDDPLTEGKQYGVIQNPSVRRRPTRQLPQAASSTSIVTSSNAAPKAAPTKSEKRNEAKRTLSSTTATKSTSEASKKSRSTKPQMARRESSDISSMFAKAKAPKSKSADTSAAATPSAASPPEDSPMKDASEDEGDDDDFVMVDNTKAEESRKARMKREELLREMMDKDDEMKDVASDSVDELRQETETEPDASEPIEKEEGKEEEEEVKVEGGRRRGRRKVMKKKVVQDEEGFLVTTEEPAWESFSEEEPEPKKAKMQQPSAAPKGKKSVKQGQGNIMSFFKKG